MDPRKKERQLKAARRLQAALADPDRKWKSEDGKQKAQKSLMNLVAKLPELQKEGADGFAW